LREAGLFRLAGHHGKQLQAEEDLDSGSIMGTEALDGLDIHTVAAILKSFLRRLPDPVCMQRLFDRVCCCHACAHLLIVCTVLQNV
jgi:hypothetical protein